MIFPVDETDADDVTRMAVCGKDQPEGICRVGTYDQLVTHGPCHSRQTRAKFLRLALFLTK